MINFYLRVKKLFSLIKKAFIILFIYFIVISLFIYFINKNKQEFTYDFPKQNQEKIYKIINDKKLNSTKEGKLIIALYRIVLCGMVGEACTNNPPDAETNFNHSLIGFISNLIVFPYVNPPASGIYWAYSGLKNAGFITKTYAAEGIGFAAIKPFMNIWKVFRDISYMLLVLVLITIGFMIMLRTKINPQTVITVENALPKIVVALLLITFSFPIAGFLIDLMYVIILLVIGILSNHGVFFNATKFQNQYLNANLQSITTYFLPLGIIPSLWDLSNSLIAIIPTFINQIIRLFIGSIIGIFVFSKLEGPIIRGILESINETLSGNPITEPVGGLGEILIKTFSFLILSFLAFLLGYVTVSIIIFILVCFTFVFLLFRIFFLLFTTYIRIFLMIVFSPIFLLFEALPGKSVFSFWLKNLLADILIFPVVITITILSYLITNILPSSGNIWTPPFLIGLNPQAFTTILGMGLFFMTPELVKIFKELIGAKGLPLNFGLGTFFGGVGSFWTGAQGGLQMITSFGQLPFIGQKIVQHPLYEKIFGPTPAKATGIAVAERFQKILEEKYGLTPKK